MMDRRERSAGTPDRRREGGFVLLQTLVATGLLLIVLTSAWAALGVVAGASEKVTSGVATLDESRLIRHLLRSEVGYAGPDRSYGDELDLRAFRGIAVRCAAGLAVWPVHVAGVRLPNPEKDSVLVLSDNGRWSVHSFVRRATSSSACPRQPGFRVEEWHLAPFPTAAVLARYFERASYELSGDAVRIRTGGGSAQPLTTPHLAEGESGAVGGADKVRVSLRWARPGVDTVTRAWTAWRAR